MTPDEQEPFSWDYKPESVNHIPELGISLLQVDESLPKIGTRKKIFSCATFAEGLFRLKKYEIVDSKELCNALEIKGIKEDIIPLPLIKAIADLKP